MNTSGFSGAIKLAEMNDYLAPNQSCIKPLMKPKKGAAAAAAAGAGVDGADSSDATKANTGTRMKVELEFNASDAGDLRFPGLQSSGGASSSLPVAAATPGGHFSQIKIDPLKKTASVSLNDCLACSGCVTSAETVLITQQSTQEFLNVLLENKAAAAAAAGSAPAVAAASSDSMTDVASSSAPSAATPAPRSRVVIVSVSPQSLTALAHDFGLSSLVCAKRLNTFFKQLGCHALLDTTPALDIALLEAREEFVERYKYSQLKGSATVAAAASSSAVSATPAAATTDADADPNTVTPTSASPLPILTSECPGWVCYCEKTQGLDVLSHVSSVKSPQAIMGSILKEHWCPSQSPPINPAAVFHTTIMPCYDKKLEGSRDDFFMQQFETRQTDCVLTTGELHQLLKDREVDMTSLEETALDSEFWNVSKDQSYLFRSVDVGGSGGYCEYLFRFAAARLFGVEFPEDQALPYKAGRNPDFRELTLEIGGVTMLSFALAYGFRNIQNLVRKMKTKKPSSSRVRLPLSPDESIEATLPSGAGGYHYVEVMACPSGCLNGGGQLKAADIKSQKQLVLDLDRVYHEERRVCEPQQNPIVQRLYTTWLQCASPYTGAARAMLHTQYHAVEKELANPLGIKW